jgi:hypothetical protein
MIEDEIQIVRIPDVIPAPDPSRPQLIPIIDITIQELSDRYPAKPHE